MRFCRTTLAVATIAVVESASVTDTALLENGDGATNHIRNVNKDKTLDSRILQGGAPVDTLPLPILTKEVDKVSKVHASGNILAGEDALAEVSIDANPTNPNNQVIVGHDGALQTMNTFYSLDGGMTWTGIPLGNADDGLRSTVRFDPALAFDDDGKVYVAYGAKITGPNRVVVVVARSSDGGQTYDQFTYVDTTNDIDTLPGNDKWMLATGPDPDIPSRRNLYIAWTQNVPEAGTDQRIVISRSTDAGATFSAPLIVNDPSITGTNSRNLFADPAVGPNGEVYVSWHSISTNQIFIDVSTDGGITFGTDILITGESVGFKTSIPAQPDRGIHAGPVIDADRSGGAFNGRVYLIYCDVSNVNTLPNTDIFVRYSDDQGSTWTNPVLVNDDGGPNSQFLPWIDIDQVSGTVSAVWYDARNDVNNKKVEVFVATSTDGGNTFSPNVMVSDNQSDMSVDNGARERRNFLEYIGVAIQDCVVHAVWTDNGDDPGDQDYLYDHLVVEDCMSPSAKSSKTSKSAKSAKSAKSLNKTKGTSKSSK